MGERTTSLGGSGKFVDSPMTGELGVDVNCGFETRVGRVGNDEVDGVTSESVEGDSGGGESACQFSRHEGSFIGSSEVETYDTSSVEDELSVPTDRPSDDDGQLSLSR